MDDRTVRFSATRKLDPNTYTALGLTERVSPAIVITHIEGVTPTNREPPTGRGRRLTRPVTSDLLSPTLERTRRVDRTLPDAVYTLSLSSLSFSLSFYLFPLSSKGPHDERFITSNIRTNTLFSLIHVRPRFLSPPRLRFSYYSLKIPQFLASVGFLKMTRPLDRFPAKRIRRRKTSLFSWG